MKEKRKHSFAARRLISLLLVSLILFGACTTLISCVGGEAGPQGEPGETGATGETGKDGKNGKDGKDGENGEDFIATMEYMHLSFDDTYKCFRNLQNNNYSSIWNEKFLGWMKGLHDTYGAVFSIYVFNEQFSEYANSSKASKYASEFYEAKDWLKIGLHSPKNDQDVNFSKDGYNTYEVGQEQWNTFVDNVLKVTGSYLSIDRMPRLHNCAGSKEAILGMRDANYGALGFLGVDDTRTVYYLGSYAAEKSQWLFTHDHLTDYANGLTFIATDIRAEYLLKSNYGKYNNMTDELSYRYTNASMANRGRAMIIFSHENRNRLTGVNCHTDVHA